MREHFSEGKVVITMGISGGAVQNSRLMTIESSGVRFESKSGRASTDRAASFAFNRGAGRSVGAMYDPATRELQMNHDVHLDWHGDDPKDVPMQVDSGSLIYKVSEAKILLGPWSKFHRQTLTMEAAASVVTVDKGAIRFVESQQAKGIDAHPDRKLEFAAGQMNMLLNEKGVVRTITGERQATLVSRSATGDTTVSTARMDLEFDTASNDSLLKKALATGGTIVESRPAARPNVLPPDSRILRSEIVSLHMRAGGKEIDRVETEAPGVAEFLPNRTGGKKRTVNGERLYMTYGLDNQIEKFRVVTAATRTEQPQSKGKPPVPPALTFSRELLAYFDPVTGAMAKLEQWDNFRYEEGERRAKSAKATLDAPKDEITLNGGARVWDSSGSTAADTIVLQQKSGDFEATANVTSTRLSDKKKPTNDGPLSSDEPVQAKATRMTATEDNTRITYEGKALLWQGANRIQADRIVIDRKSGQLDAHGNVVSQLLDKAESSTAAKKVPVYTIVKAPDMTYFDKERIAHYKGGAVLTRDNTVVNALEIRAYLKSGQAESSLEKAIADGNVRIVETSPGKVRTGLSEHAEYYASDGRLLLNGGKARFIDGTDGATEGSQLTWFRDKGRLLVEGAQGQPVESKLLRK
ncbi:MAG: LptA/OstA family protein [Bryobacteraceae bacterium]